MKRICSLLLVLVIGILLLIKPVGFTSGIIVIIGLLLAAQGIKSIVQYFKMKPAEASKEQLLSKGLIGTLIGCFCMFRSRWFIATFPVLTMIYGVMILLEKSGVKCAGKHVVVIGRSNIVGKPMTALMLQKNPQANATVTCVHSMTENLTELVRQGAIDNVRDKKF